MNNPASCEQTSYCYRFGTAQFDEARFELRVAGLPVEVERRALEVLACLLRHAGEVVTKEELLSQVWAGRITVDQVLPNAIAKLRRALGETNAKRLVTQTRIGYRLDGTIERVAVGGKLTSRLELAPGQPAPGRENFLLQRQLGSNRGSEVWLAQHAKTHERRVYKFGSDGERLRALKREATLSRVLRESLDDHSHFVDVIDWNFEHAPFFLESGYGGENLLEWSGTTLPAMSQKERLALFVQIVEAVAAAHGVGVLHKDLKPANVLIAEKESGWQVRLTDFGSGRLLEPERLEALGISQLGVTVTQNPAIDSSPGTPLYIAPEIFSGHAPTARSDIFALGIILYQLLSGDLGKPMVSSWEQDIDDELLCEDIRLATHGNPALRLASATDFAARLHDLDRRREEARRAQEDRAQAQRMRDALARSRARRPYVAAFGLALVVGAVVALGLWAAARRAGNQAQLELARANAINLFLNEDLIGQANPLVLAKGRDAPLKDVLLAARGQIPAQFAAQPLTEASLHASLSKLFGTIELLPEAETEARQALNIYEHEEGADSSDALKARAVLAHYLILTSQFTPVRDELEALDRLSAGAVDPYAKARLMSVWGDYHLSQAEYARAATEYRQAIKLAPLETSTATRDALRLNLVRAELQNGRAQQARQEASDLLDEMQSRSNKNPLGIAFAQTMLARALILNGDYIQAESLLLDAQKTVVGQLGDKHSQNLTLLNDLLDIATRRQDWPRALDYAQHLHTASVAKFGNEHLASNVILGTWGQILYESGEAREAQAKLEPAYRGLVKQTSTENPQVQCVSFWLAAADIELGRTDQATALLATLKPALLETAVADGGWASRLDVLRGLLLDRQRGNNDNTTDLLRSALESLKHGSAVDDIIAEKAKLALRAHRGKSSGI